MHKDIHFRIDTRFILSAIILSGALLRLVAINKAVWFDEALSIYTARLPLSEIIPFMLKGIDMHPPIFVLLLHFLLKISPSEIWLRMFSFVCGLAVLYMTYKLGKKIFNTSVGLLSCILVTYSESFIYYSVEIRGYTLWALLSLLSIYSFIRSIESPSRKSIIFYVISTTLCIYTHYFGILILLSEYLSLFINKKKAKTNMRLWGLNLACILILFTPQIAYLHLILQRFALWGDFYQHKLSLIRNIYSLLESYSGYRGLLFLYASIIIYLVLNKSRNNLFVISALYNNIKDMLIKLLRNPGINISFIYLIFPIVLISLFSQGKYSFLEERYLLPSFIFFYISVAYSVSLCEGKIKRFIIILIVLVNFTNAVRYSIFLKNDQQLGIKKTAELLKPRLQKDDIVATSDVFHLLHIFNYLDTPIRIVATPQEVEEEYLFRLLSSGKNIFITDFGYFKNQKRLWLISGHMGGSTDTWLTESARVRLISRVEVERVEIRLYGIL